MILFCSYWLGCDNETDPQRDVVGGAWQNYSATLWWRSPVLGAAHFPNLFFSPSSYTGPPLWPSGQSSWLQNGDVLFPVRYEQNLYMLCRRK
jgi:hypothetical protein